MVSCLSSFLSAGTRAFEGEGGFGWMGLGWQSHAAAGEEGGMVVNPTESCVAAGITVSSSPLSLVVVVVDLIFLFCLAA